MIRRLAVAAGGTGGHIFPALSLYDWLRREHGDVDVRFFCGSRAIEREIYASCGVEPSVLALDGSPFGAMGAARLKRCWQLVGSFFDARRALKEFAPDVCLTFGGYVSFPAFAAAKSLGIPCLCHEQNAFAGRMTRAASKRGATIACGWSRCDGMKEGSFVYTGTPVREFNLVSRDDAWLGLKLPGEAPNRPIVVMMTGSLGSTGITDMAEQLLSCDELGGWVVAAVDSSSKVPVRKTDDLYLLPRDWDPTLMFSLADVVVARGGASTLSELASMDIPSVAAPWRGAAGDHQMKNALQFAESGLNRALWDERGEGAADLARKITHLYGEFARTRGNEAEKMYNKRGNACESLWSLTLRACRNDEGRCLHEGS